MTVPGGDVPKAAPDDVPKLSYTYICEFTVFGRGFPCIRLFRLTI